MECKRRKDSFFGIHYDFHATPEKCNGHKIGETLTKEDIAEICESIAPDFLQIDCKGHPGYTSYPTKTALGKAAAEFEGNPLKLWREVTAEHGVALYMHYSGVWDSHYIKEHPDHIVITADGTPEKRGGFTSLFCDYVDTLMIPQLLELVDYGVDGVWVDGDCWATMVEYNSQSMEAFYRKTGIRLTPEEIHKGQPHFDEYRDFCRQQFRNYVTRYTDAVHAKNPAFQVASNWAYSEQMPEKVSAPVDFLSGDYAPNNSFEGALFGGRILAGQNMPWDLMAWGFRRRQAPDETTISRDFKDAVQLMQEAAAVIALGGGFQVYINQDALGRPNMGFTRQMIPLAKFCRERQPYCFRNKTLPNVALFNSTYDHDRALPESVLFGRYQVYHSIVGWTSLLSDAGHSFEILEEHNLLPNIDAYSVVVCPQINEDYEQATVDRLLQYAKDGGCLVLAGEKTLARFGEKLSVPMQLYSESPLEMFAMAGEYRIDECMCTTYELTGEGTPLAFFAKNEPTDKVFAREISCGKGKIIAIGGDIGKAYGTYKNIALRKMGEKLFDYYTPTARVTNSHYVNLNATEKNGNYYIQLVNTAGDHSNDRINSYDELPVLTDLHMELALSGKTPKAIFLQPGNQPLSWKEENGKLILTVPKVSIHEILELQF